MAFFEYNGTKMYYEVIGEGVPFLLIHGWRIEHSFLERCMEPVFLDVTRSFKRIYVDLPGMGQSLPGQVKNGDGMIEVLDAFMEFIAPGESFYIGGNSFGTVVSRALAARCPQKVLGLLLIAPAGDHKIEGAECGIYTADYDFLNSLSQRDRKIFMYMNANLTRETWERFEQYVLPSVNSNDNNDFLNYKLKGSFSFDINKKLIKEKFDKPILLLTAKYDLAVGYKEQFKWLDLFKSATYVVIDGAGHNMNIDQPEIFRSVVSGFINNYFV